MARTDNNRHRLLVQAPLTVSPTAQFPSGRDLLPYGFVPAPTTLPTTILDRSFSNDPSAGQSTAGSLGPAERHQPALDVPSRGYVLGPGFCACPSEITAVCNTFLASTETDTAAAIKSIDGWKKQMKDNDLAEKRRIAPGWLDSDQRVLVPENMRKDNPSQPGPGISQTHSQGSTLAGKTASSQAGSAAAQDSRNEMAEQLELAFGNIMGNSSAS